MVFCFFTGPLLYSKDGEEALSSLFRVKGTQDMKLLPGELRFKAGPSDYFHFPPACLHSEFKADFDVGVFM